MYTHKAYTTDGYHRNREDQ